MSIFISDASKLSMSNVRLSFSSGAIGILVSRQ
jgi:hypothetical protein